MFIVIEGIDGAGCETQAKLVYEKLKKAKTPASFIKYPNYNNPFGKIIKNFLYENHKLDVKEQFLLYSMQFIFDSDKIQSYCHSRESGNPISKRPIENWIPGSSPRMTKGTPVILIADRYFTTTLCYQTLEGIDENVALRFARDFDIIKPDLVFYLDVKVNIAIKRKFGEDKILNFREKDRKFIKKTYDKYQDLIDRQVWTKWIKINGERKPDVIAEEITNVILEGA